MSHHSKGSPYTDKKFRDSNTRSRVCTKLISCSIRTITLIGLIVISTAIQGQDIHFSQFFLTDLSSNPAAAGDFDGDYRLSAVHRNQWKSVSQPFSTFQFSADARDAFGNRNLGLGMRIFNDKAGDSHFNTFSVSFDLAGRTSLNSDSTLKLHSGVQVGYTQLRLDYTNLQFDEQYNGFIYDGTLYNGEMDQGDRVGHMDVHVGMYVHKEIDRFRSWTIGVSAWNLSAPKVNFNSNELVKLDQRISLMADYQHRLADDWSLIPAARAMFQGPYQELLIGGRIRHTLAHDAHVNRKIYLGAFSRIRDGAYIAIGLEHDAWTIGLSYDVNLSSLEVASRNRGAFELAIIRVFDVFKEVRKPHRQCIDLL